VRDTKENREKKMAARNPGGEKNGQAKSWGQEERPHKILVARRMATRDPGGEKNAKGL